MVLVLRLILLTNVDFVILTQPVPFGVIVKLPLVSVVEIVLAFILTLPPQIVGEQTQVEALRFPVTCRC